MIAIRFHGRGGQGAKAASRIVGRAGFLAGLFAQDFPLFGAERRGAPVVATTRLDREVIRQRGYVEDPDLVVVMDDSLLKETHLKILHGLRPGAFVLINSHGGRAELAADNLHRVVHVPLTLIALRLIGHHSLSAVAKFVPEFTGEVLEEAISIELAEIGLSRELIRKNTLAAKAVYAGLPAFSLPERAPEWTAPTERPAPLSLREVLSGATIPQPGNTILRQTGSWRVERPEIDLVKCKRCFLCFLYCPDAAIDLDAENYPHIDYEHCKGCMICYEECPPAAISRRLEAETIGS